MRLLHDILITITTIVLNIAIMITQRAQYPLIKEYSLNHNMKPLII